MDFYEALRARLLADSAVSAIVGTKVAWEEQPQGVEAPHVTLTTISDTRPEHLKGYQETRSTRVQADCRALTFAQALALAHAVIAAVEAPGTFFGHRFGRTKAEGPRSIVDDVEDHTVRRQSVDLISWHVGG